LKDKNISSQLQLKMNQL